MGSGPVLEADQYAGRMETSHSIMTYTATMIASTHSGPLLVLVRFPYRDGTVQNRNEYQEMSHAGSNCAKGTSQECVVERQDSSSGSVETISILAFLVGYLVELVAAVSCISNIVVSWYDSNHLKGGGEGEGRCTPEDIQNGNTIGCTSSWTETRED